MKSISNTRARARAARMTVVLAAAVMCTAWPLSLRAQTEGDYLYKVLLLRAAPGEFTRLIETLAESERLLEEAGDHAPFWMRHSQGDQWDFMLIYPMADVAAYFTSDRVSARRSVWETARGRDLKARMEAQTAYAEEWFSRSASLDEVTRRFDGMDFFHIEMFAGLPGKREELFEQRRMENRYYEHLGRQQNLLFLREGGSSWDAMTIGFYEDLQTFAAAGPRFSADEQDEAARVAGFEGVSDISPYLRSLIAYHHDTLAVRVR